jgi:hypothetical protein
LKFLFILTLAILAVLPGCGASSGEESDEMSPDCTVCGCWGDFGYANQCAGDMDATCSDDPHDARDYCNEPPLDPDAVDF